MSRMSVAPAPRVAPALHPLKQLISRLPLRAQALPLVGAFGGSLLLYARMAGLPVLLHWGLLSGMATTLLLFVQLRLVDDLDDLDSDHPSRTLSALSQKAALRRKIVFTLVALAALVVALNVTRPPALLAAVAATATTYAGPFVFKRHLPTRMALGSIVYEGAPALFFAHPYFFWWADSGVALSVGQVLPVVAAFWLGYEVWKFSRKATTDAMQPYLLSSQGVKRALTVFFVASGIVNVALARQASLSPSFMAIGLALPALFLVWLHASWPATGSRPRTHAPVWGGLPFILAFEVGLLRELAVGAA